MSFRFPGRDGEAREPVKLSDPLLALLLALGCVAVLYAVMLVAEP